VAHSGARRWELDDVEGTVERQMRGLEWSASTVQPRQRSGHGGGFGRWPVVTRRRSGGAGAVMRARNRAEAQANCGVRQCTS
jgi:hypothetical protein